ncbi:hypothetical protein JCM8097_008647 [Rhodosporidiobolus ruineniae]
MASSHDGAGPSSSTLDALDRELASLETSPTSTARPAKPHLDAVDDSDEGFEQLYDEDDASSAVTAELHTKLARRRIYILGAACCLSIGSHFSTYLLGPLKKSLKTSESHFAALISAFELLNTVTPLISGFLVPRYGAAACGLVATGAVLLGQLIVCLAQSSEGGVGGNIGGMVFGLLIFGSGISPLAVVQESILLKHNSSSSRFVARSVAIGLVLGKTASFAAGWSSDKLNTISPRLPFLVAAGLSLFSFLACVFYAAVERSSSRLLAASASAAPSSGDAYVSAAKLDAQEAAHPHRPLKLSALASFGDAFWLYIVVCGLAGAWYTTNHLSSHFLQSVYQLSQKEASSKASILLAMSTFLYPLIGWALDKRPEILSKLWLAVPVLTATTYFILLTLSAAILAPTLALLPAALGMGSGPLLLVVVVPRMVQQDQAATALGAHKSLEMAGAIVFQTVCGFLLSFGATPGSEEDDTLDNADYALSFLFVAALVMLGVVVRWWVVIRRSGEGTGEKGGREDEASARIRDDAEYGLLAADSTTEDDASDAEVGQVRRREDAHELDALDGEMGRKEREELERGRRALKIAAGVVVLSWVCFVVNLL